MDADEVQSLKDKGNECVRSAKYEESILHYTHAIKLDPKNFSLYSNRSLAFLKIQQFYHAMEDANETIRLNPNWAKGYFRRAEVEFATFHFSGALLSYSLALKLQPSEKSIMDAIMKTTKELKKDKRADDQIPWLGAGIGIILGVTIVIADQLLTTQPSLTHPILMAIMTIAVAMVGYGSARGFRYYVKCQREALIQPPVDLLDLKKETEMGTEVDATETVKEERTHQKYTKAQARQRFKKGRT